MSFIAENGKVNYIYCRQTKAEVTGRCQSRDYGIG